MNIEQILSKSAQMHRLNKDQQLLFAELKNVSPDVLNEWEQLWSPKENFWPVITLRYMVVKKLQQGENVTLETIEDMKSAITNRDISAFGDFNDEFLESLINYPRNEKGMFPQWQEPFKVLYQFFYTNKEKEQVVKLMKTLGEQIISRYQIPDAKVHIVGFDGGQNYGSQRAWGVIIPKKAGGPREAYQILFAANEGKIEGGLYIGHGLKDSGFEIRRKVYENWEVYLEDVKNFLPRWQELNNQLDFSFSKNESSLKKVLGKIKPEDRDIYFTMIDELVDELKIPNEKNLVFSIALPGLSFQVGKRYCLNLKKNRFSFLAPTDYLLEGFEKEEFTHGQKAFLYHGFTGKEVINHYTFMARAIQHEIERDANVSEYHYDNAAFRQAVFDKEYRSTLFAPVIEIELPKKPKIKEMPDKRKLNLILFGPPGTGKTYNALPLALNIINGFELKDSYTNQEWKRLKEQFDVLREKGRIEFVTFHQSMSYEDFVEGIKPKMDQAATETVDGAERLQYEICDGVFKRIADRAAATEKISQQSENYMMPHDILSKIDNVNFGKIRFENWAPGNEVYEYCMANDCICIPYEIDYDFTDSNSETQTEKISTENHFGWHEKVGIKTIKHWMKKNNIVFITSVGENIVKAVAQVTGDYYYNPDSDISFSHFRKVKWLMKDVNIPVDSVYSTQFSSYAASLLYTERVKKDFFKQQYRRENLKYVLIIDEINRGNIANIFGELITLLEPSKRVGESEHLKIKLPYSKSVFEISSNLYLIGTMNTADRSVEALDTALRRRFSFREMPPDPELIKTAGALKETSGKLGDIDLVKLLETINYRLEKLIDKDHRIGHSYFMHIKSKDELVQTFKDKIIPLLEEYFFGDFGKIGLVLGSSFVEKVTDTAVFAPFDDYDKSAAQDLAERPVYRIKDGGWDFKSIYQF